MKIKEMKKILDLKSEKEKCKIEIMQLKMNVEKEKTLLKTLRKPKSSLYVKTAKYVKLRKRITNGQTKILTPNIPATQRNNKIILK